MFDLADFGLSQKKGIMFCLHGFLLLCLQYAMITFVIGTYSTYTVQYRVSHLNSSSFLPSIPLLFCQHQIYLSCHYKIIIHRLPTRRIHQKNIDNAYLSFRRLSFYETLSKLLYFKSQSCFGEKNIT